MPPSHSSSFHDYAGPPPSSSTATASSKSWQRPPPSSQAIRPTRSTSSSSLYDDRDRDLRDADRERDRDRLDRDPVRDRSLRERERERDRDRERERDRERDRETASVWYGDAEFSSVGRRDWDYDPRRGRNSGPSPSEDTKRKWEEELPSATTSTTAAATTTTTTANNTTTSASTTGTTGSHGLPHKPISSGSTSAAAGTSSDSFAAPPPPTGSNSSTFYSSRISRDRWDDSRDFRVPRDRERERDIDSRDIRDRDRERERDRHSISGASKPSASGPSPGSGQASGSSSESARDRDIRIRDHDRERERDRDINRDLLSRDRDRDRERSWWDFRDSRDMRDRDRYDRYGRGVVSRDSYSSGIGSSKIDSFRPSHDSFREKSMDQVSRPKDSGFSDKLSSGYREERERSPHSLNSGTFGSYGSHSRKVSTESTPAQQPSSGINAAGSEINGSASSTNTFAFGSDNNNNNNKSTASTPSAQDRSSKKPSNEDDLFPHLLEEATIDSNRQNSLKLDVSGKMSSSKHTSHSSVISSKTTPLGTPTSATFSNKRYDSSTSNSPFNSPRELPLSSKKETASKIEKSAYSSNSLTRHSSLPSKTKPKTDETESKSSEASNYDSIKSKAFPAILPTSNASSDLTKKSTKDTSSAKDEVNVKQQQNISEKQNLHTNTAESKLGTSKNASQPRLESSTKLQKSNASLSTSSSASTTRFPSTKSSSAHPSSTEANKGATSSSSSILASSAPSTPNTTSFKDPSKSKRPLSSGSSSNKTSTTDPYTSLSLSRPTNTTSLSKTSNTGSSSKLDSSSSKDTSNRTVTSFKDIISASRDGSKEQEKDGSTGNSDSYHSKNKEISKSQVLKEDSKSRANSLPLKSDSSASVVTNNKADKDLSKDSKELKDLRDRPKFADEDVEMKEVNKTQSASSVPSKQISKESTEVTKKDVELKSRPVSSSSGTGFEKAAPAKNFTSTSHLPSTASQVSDPSSTDSYSKNKSLTSRSSFGPEKSLSTSTSNSSVAKSYKDDKRHDFYKDIPKEPSKGLSLASGLSNSKPDYYKRPSYHSRHSSSYNLPAKPVDKYKERERSTPLTSDFGTKLYSSTSSSKPVTSDTKQRTDPSPYKPKSEFSSKQTTPVGPRDSAEKQGFKSSAPYSKSIDSTSKVSDDKQAESTSYSSTSLTTKSEKQPETTYRSKPADFSNAKNSIDQLGLKKEKPLSSVPGPKSVYTKSDSSVSISGKNKSVIDSTASRAPPSQKLSTPASIEQPRVAKKETPEESSSISSKRAEENKLTASSKVDSAERSNNTAIDPTLGKNKQLSGRPEVAESKSVDKRDASTVKSSSSLSIVAESLGGAKKVKTIKSVATEKDSISVSTLDESKGTEVSQLSNDTTKSKITIASLKLDSIDAEDLPLVFPLNRLEQAIYDIQQLPHDEFVKDMKYLTTNHIKSLKEYAFYARNIRINNTIVRPVLQDSLSRHNRKLFNEGKVFKSQFENIKSAWLRFCDSMDESSMPKPTTSSLMAAVQLQRDSSSSGSGRRGRNHGDSVRSEAEFLEILANFERESARDPEARAKLTSAQIPKLIFDPIVRDEIKYMDSNNFIEDKSIPYQRLITDNINDFTPEEHDAFCEAYTLYPKQFGKIAKTMGCGRTFHDCVLHYYQTKKHVDYKAMLLNKNRRTTRKGRKKQQKERQQKQEAAQAASAQANLQNSDGLGVDVDGLSVPPSAPTSAPGTAMASPISHPVTLKIGAGHKFDNAEGTPASGSLLSEHNVDPSSNIPELSISEDKKGATASFINENQPASSANIQSALPEPGSLVSSVTSSTIPTAAPTPSRPSSPVGGLGIAGKRKTPDDKLANDSDYYTDSRKKPRGVKGSRSTRGKDKKKLDESQIDSGMVSDSQDRPQTPDFLTGRGNGEHKERASSYWSVSDLNLFQRLLLSYGTNFPEIAKHFKLKSVVMVKNCFTKHANKRGWDKIVNDANDRLSKGLPTPVPPAISEDIVATNKRRTRGNVIGNQTNTGATGANQTAQWGSSMDPASQSQYSEDESSNMQQMQSHFQAAQTLKLVRDDSQHSYHRSAPSQSSSAYAEVALINALDKKRQANTAASSPVFPREPAPTVPDMQTTSEYTQSHYASSQSSYSYPQKHTPGSQYSYPQAVPSYQPTARPSMSPIQHLLHATEESRQMLPPLHQGNYNKDSVTQKQSPQINPSSTEYKSSYTLPLPAVLSGSASGAGASGDYYLPKPNIPGFDTHAQSQSPRFGPSPNLPQKDYESEHERQSKEGFENKKRELEQREKEEQEAHKALEQPKSSNYQPMYPTAPATTSSERRNPLMTISSVASGVPVNRSIPSLASLSEVAANSYPSTYNNSESIISSSAATAEARTPAVSSRPPLPTSNSISNILNPAPSSASEPVQSSYVPATSSSSSRGWYDPVRQTSMGSSSTSQSSSGAKTFAQPSNSRSSYLSVVSNIRNSPEVPIASPQPGAMSSQALPVSSHHSVGYRSQNSSPASLAHILQGSSSSSQVGTGSGNVQSSSSPTGPGYLPMPSSLSRGGADIGRGGSPVTNTAPYGSTSNSPVPSSSQLPVGHGPHNSSHYPTHYRHGSQGSVGSYSYSDSHMHSTGHQTSHFQAYPPSNSSPPSRNLQMPPGAGSYSGIHMYGSHYRPELSGTAAGGPVGGNSRDAGSQGGDKGLHQQQQKQPQANAPSAPSGMAGLLSSSPKSFGYDYTSRESNERGMSQK